MCVNECLQTSEVITACDTVLGGEVEAGSMCVILKSIVENLDKVPPSRVAKDHAMKTRLRAW
jgi:hypothetical protein